MKSSAVKPKNKKSKKKLLIGVVILLILIGGSVLGVMKYHNSQSNKIYSVGQAMKYPGFKVTLTKAQLKPVDLPLNKDVVAKYGGITTDENCDTFSKAPTPKTELQSILPNANLVPNPSPYNFCIRRNDSRKDLRAYTSQNKQINLDYIIQASATVDTKDIKIHVLPDSGRNPNPSDKPFNGNELLFDNLSNDEEGVYTLFQAYTPYFQSSLGGNVNNGLSRSGYIYTDVRNTEKSADFSLSYKQAGKTITKITRVPLDK